jgi:hypothetical protein
MRPTQSLIIGTDKDADGALYVCDLNGKIIPDVPVLFVGRYRRD